MRHFKNCHLARMSDGHYCVIRDLGPVKGGKGLKHHEVVIDFTWRALVRFLPLTRRRKAPQPRETEIRPPPPPTLGKNLKPGLAAERPD
jgi:hypothetical protein